MKHKITREDIAKKISQDFGISYTLAYSKIEKIIKYWSEFILTSDFSITSLGTFLIKHKASRLGRNPKSKIEYMIDSRKNISFKKSKKLEI